MCVKNLKLGPLKPSKPTQATDFKSLLLLLSLPSNKFNYYKCKCCYSVTNSKCMGPKCKRKSDGSRDVGVEEQSVLTCGFSLSNHKYHRGIKFDKLVFRHTSQT